VGTRRLRAVADRAEPEVTRLFWDWAAELRSIARVNWVEARPVASSSRQIRRLQLDLDRPALTALRARAVFGVGARADIICALLAREGQWLRASDLLDVGYTKSTANTVLSDLARARVLESAAQSNAIVYTLRPTSPLKELLGASDNVWIPWGHVFRIVTRLVRLESVCEKPASVLRVYADQARRDLEPSVTALGWPEMPPTSDVLTGYQRMVQWGTERLADLL
jgi:hypothetical protein